MNEKIKELIIFISKNSEAESSFLFPVAEYSWNINSHSVLDKIKELYDLNDQEIDDILKLNQPE